MILGGRLRKYTYLNLQSPEWATGVPVAADSVVVLVFLPQILQIAVEDVVVLYHS